jgi:hypothetical protein
MEKETYTRYTLCSELLELIDNDATSDEIASWASSVYCRIFDEKGVHDILDDLSFSEEPEFYYPSRDGIIKLCVKLIEGASLENFTSLEHFIESE